MVLVSKGNLLLSSTDCCEPMDLCDSERPAAQRTVVPSHQTKTTVQMQSGEEVEIDVGSRVVQAGACDTTLASIDCLEGSVTVYEFLCSLVDQDNGCLTRPIAHSLVFAVERLVVTNGYDGDLESLLCATFQMCEQYVIKHGLFENHSFLLRVLVLSAIEAIKILEDPGLDAAATIKFLGWNKGDLSQGEKWFLSAMDYTLLPPAAKSSITAVWATNEGV